MRLWHYELLPFLPKSQLLAQKRECDLILKDYKQGKRTNHILINYIHNYEIDYFITYYCELANEFVKRNFKFKDNAPFGEFILEPPFAEHNDEYLTICYWNLREKYIRGQKDFSAELWEKLDKFYKERKQNENNN